VKLNLNLAHIYLHIMMSGKKLVMVRSSLPTSRGSQYNMQYVGARMHAKWHGVCGLCWGWGGRTGDKRRVPPGQKLSVDFPLGEK